MPSTKTQTTLSPAQQKKLYREERRRRAQRMSHLPSLSKALARRMAMDEPLCNPKDAAEEAIWDAELKKCVDAMRAWKLKNMLAAREEEPDEEELLMFPFLRSA